MPVLVLVPVLLVVVLQVVVVVVLEKLDSIPVCSHKYYQVLLVLV
jgi:hypothetical protein